VVNPMPTYGRMSRYTIGTTAGSIRLDGGRRVVLRTDADIDVAYDVGDFENGQFFSIAGGEVYVFDPNPVTGEVDSLDYLFYAKTSAGTATVQVWIQ